MYSSPPQPQFYPAEKKSLAEAPMRSKHFCGQRVLYANFSSIYFKPPESETAYRCTFVVTYYIIIIIWHAREKCVTHNINTPVQLTCFKVYYCFLPFGYTDFQPLLWTNVSRKGGAKIIFEVPRKKWCF